MAEKGRNVRVDNIDDFKKAIRGGKDAEEVARRQEAARRLELKRRRQRKRRRIKRIIIAILVILIIIALLGFIVFKVFRVENVVVEGNELYDAQVIEDTVLDDDYSWNSLYVFLKYKFVKTEAVPFIDTMEVTLTDPKTLHITVYEKGIMGYIYISSIGENAYFDKDGFVVETSSEKIADTPQVRGLDCDTVVLYEKLPIDDSTLRDILTLTQTLKRSDLVPDTITYGVKNEPVLTFGSIKVEMGDIDLLTQKVARLEKIMPELTGKSGTLDLSSWTEQTTNIVFDEN